MGVTDINGGSVRSEFLDLLSIQQVGWENKRSKWMTLAPLRYRSVYLGGEVIYVPAEFIYDLASVPRLPGAWLLAGGKGNRSATIHDWAYQYGYFLILRPDGVLWKRYVEKKPSDDVFGESLVADPMSGAGKTTADIMWAAVRSFGRGVWANTTRHRKLNPTWAVQGVPEVAAP